MCPFDLLVTVGGAFTLSLVDAGARSVGVVWAVMHVLLQVQVGPSGVDVTNILIKAVGVARGVLNIYQS